MLVVAHTELGYILFYLGELGLAREHLEQVLALYDPAHHATWATIYPIDPVIASRSLLPRLLWLLGFPDKALEQIPEALTLAQKLSNPYNLAFSHARGAIVHQLCREVQRTQERVEVGIALASDHGYADCSAVGMILRGWAIAEQGRGDEGIAQMREALGALRDRGNETFRPHGLVLLAEEYGKAGQVERGLAVVAEALVALESTGIRFHEAELYRLQGELLLMAGRGSRAAAGSASAAGTDPSRPGEAEACYRRALAVARRQGAKSWELRAAMSLTRLAQRQGQPEDARQLLAATYSWFTEGFDTLDLQEAKALLDDLSSQPTPPGEW
jgi:predicted ATPase